jgi:hypothetical protein
MTSRERGGGGEGGTFGRQHEQVHHLKSHGHLQDGQQAAAARSCASPNSKAAAGSRCYVVKANDGMTRDHNEDVAAWGLGGTASRRRHLDVGATRGNCNGRQGDRVSVCGSGANKCLTTTARLTAQGAEHDAGKGC